MEEPLELFEEPDDESLRQELPKGVFTGIYVTEAEESLDELEELEEEPVGILVDRLVENSPGEAAGLEKGDLLVEVRVNDQADATELRWPSQWRELELAAAAGDVFHVVYERAATDRQAAIKTEKRYRTASRAPIARLREETKVGVVVRTATEVEARQAGLPPGGGAVVVGLSRGSPWRKAGVQFEDMLVGVSGTPVDDPQVVLDAIENAKTGEAMALEIVRKGERMTLNTTVSEREQEVRGFTIPGIFSHEDDRGTSETSFLMGLLGYKSTPVAWEFRFLWLIRFTGGDADKLEEVEEPRQ